MGFSSIYFYSVVSSILTDQAVQNMNTGLAQSVDRLETSMEIIDISSLHFFSNDLIRSWISDEISFSSDPFRRIVNKLQLDEALRYSMLFNSAWDMRFIKSAFLFMDENTYSSISRGMEVSLNMQNTTDRYTNIYRLLASEGTQGLLVSPPASKDPTLYFSRNVINPTHKDQVLYLILGIDEGIISEQYQDLTSNKSMIYLVDTSGIIYSSTNKSLLGERVSDLILNAPLTEHIQELSFDTERFFIAKRAISGTNLSLIAGIPKSQILSQLEHNVRNYLIILISFALLFLLATILASFGFTQFIKDILFHINTVKLGNYGTRMPRYKDHDLNQISETFNNMTDEIGSLIDEVYEKQLLLRESEIKFLQSQMDPHFLFNTLVSVSTIAKLENQETIYQMVNALTHLLQASIDSNPRTKIKISQEIEYTRLYLYLQKMRFNDMLNYEFHIENPSLLDLYIPRLCVEPLVENSVIHGIEPGRNPGKVTVSVIRKEDTVQIVIEDNGAGFDPRHISSSNSTSERRHNNIGIHNCNKRIKLIYGEKYGIDIDSVITEGTTVTLHIPVDEGDPDNV